LFVDDILTTGATARAAAQSLIKAGPQRSTSQHLHEHAAAVSAACNLITSRPASHRQLQARFHRHPFSNHLLNRGK
jgi:hypothetical protein